MEIIGKEKLSEAIYVRLPKRLHDKLKKISKKEVESISTICRNIITSYLNNLDKK